MGFDGWVRNGRCWVGGCWMNGVRWVGVERVGAWMKDVELFFFIQLLVSVLVVELV